MRIPFIWDTPRDKVAFIGLVVIPVLLAIALSACAVDPNKSKYTKSSKVTTVDKQELYEMTYEWAMYKEIAIQALVKIHGCSKEDAAAFLEEQLNNDVAVKKFIADVEFEQKWKRTNP